MLLSRVLSPGTGGVVTEREADPGLSPLPLRDLIAYT